MLSTPKWASRGLRRVAALALAIGVAGCATAPRTAVVDGGIDVDPNQPVTVALLVPQGSGDPGREQIARSLVNAAQLAQSDLQNATIDLRIYPDAGTAAGGAAAARKAVDEGAKIIVGPLFSTATAGAQGVAGSAGLTVLSLSNNPEVAGGNTWILGNTFQNSADRLAAYGLGRGLRAYGVVHPAGLEGETARNAAVAAIRARGGEVVGTAPYSVSMAGIQSSGPATAASLAAAGANAVVLTDGPTGGLVYIADALRAGGLPAGQVQFLGLQRWDVSPEALTQPSLDGGVFATADPALTATFAGRYRNVYGEAPGDVAGFAYDAIAAIGAMIADARANGGSPFAPARLTAPTGFAGVNGAFRLLPGGLNQRNLAIMEVRGGQAVVAEPAARSFAGVFN